MRPLVKKQATRVRNIAVSAWIEGLVCTTRRLSLPERWLDLEFVFDMKRQVMLEVFLEVF